MIETLFALLVTLIIFGVIWYIIDVLPIIPSFLKGICKAIVAIALIFYLLNNLPGI